MKSRAITLKIGATTYYKKWDDTQNIWLIQLKTECLRQSRFHFLGNRALTFAYPRASSEISSILSISKSKKWPGSNSLGLRPPWMDEFRFELPAVWFGRLQDENMKCFLDPIYSRSAFFQNPMLHMQSGLISLIHIIYHFLFLDTLR